LPFPSRAAVRCGLLHQDPTAPRGGAARAHEERNRHSDDWSFYPERPGAAGGPTNL